MKTLKLFVLPVLIIFALTSSVFAQPGKARRGGDKEFKNEKANANREYRNEWRRDNQDPKAAELREQIRLLQAESWVIAKKYHAAKDDAEKAKIKEEYKVKTAQIYDLRLQEMENRITVMQTTIEDLKKNRDAKINETAEKNIERIGNRDRDKGERFKDKQGKRGKGNRQDKE